MYLNYAINHKNEYIHESQTRSF